MLCSNIIQRQTREMASHSKTPASPCPNPSTRATRHIFLTSARPRTCSILLLSAPLRTCPILLLSAPLRTCINGGRDPIYRVPRGGEAVPMLILWDIQPLAGTTPPLNPAEHDNGF